MSDIDYIDWILNSDLLLNKDGLTMIEPADADNEEHTVSVKCASNAIKDMKLYSFNTAETRPEKLLPFFNQRREDPKAPKDLNRFSDYVLLVQHDDGLFVFIIEMKRGRHEDAEKQIHASESFFDYVLQSAMRIKDENGYSDFDANQVRYRRIVINEEHSNKKMTKDKDVEVMDLDSVILHKCYKEFRPIAYCKRN